MAKIYSATNLVANVGGTNHEHLYLVFDPDDDVYNRNEFIIRGGPAGNIPGFFGNIVVDSGARIDQSRDDYSGTGDDPFSDRHYTDISANFNGLNVENVWQYMAAHAENIGDSDISYQALTQNSNSVFSSVVSSVDVSQYSVLPNVDPFSFSWPGVFSTLSQVTLPSDGYRGSDGKFYLLGNGGNNSISGNSPSNSYVLDGGNGSDTLRGNSGNDVLYGGAGSDVLQGGGGSDVFTGYASELNGDRIIDFQRGDSIVLRGFNNASNSNGRIDSSVSGQIRIDADGNGSHETTIYANIPSGGVINTGVTPGATDSITISVGDPGAVFGYGLSGFPLSSSGTVSLVAGGNSVSSVNLQQIHSSMAWLTNITEKNGSVYTLGNFSVSTDIRNSDVPFGLHLFQIDPQSGQVTDTHSMFLDWLWGPSGGRTGNEVKAITATSGDTFYGVGRRAGGYDFLFSFNKNSLDAEWEGLLISDVPGITRVDTIDLSPTGALYGWYNGYQSGGLVRIDIVPNDFNNVVQIGASNGPNIQSISFTSDGHLVGLGENGTLYQINTSSGAATSIGAGPDVDLFEATGSLSDWTTQSGGDTDTVSGDVVVGGEGSDNLTGSVGADTISADDGNDSIAAGSGDDRVIAGVGDDLIYGNRGADIVYGNQGSDTLFGGQDSDTLFGGQDHDVLYGNLASDIIYGNFSWDRIFGGQDDDVLYGGQGDDTVNGNLGNDSLFGNLGNDVIGGGGGNDTLVGGGGADRFDFQSGGGSDLVTDFDAAIGDRISVQSNINGTGITNSADLLARTASDGNGNAVVDLGAGQTVTLIGVNRDSLQDWAFVIG